MIYTVGDSHTHIFKGKEGFKCLEDSAFTAYNFFYDEATRHYSDSYAKFIEQTRGLGGERLIVSYGEIDCRKHIYNEAIKQGISVSEAIEKTIKVYVDTLKSIKHRFKLMVLSIPPVNYPDDYPKIKKEFNEKLEIELEKWGIPFINIYPEVSDENGFMKDEFKQEDGEIHLNSKAGDIAIKKIASLIGGEEAIK